MLNLPDGRGVISQYVDLTNPGITLDQVCVSVTYR